MCIDSLFFITLLDRYCGDALKGINVTVSEDDIAETSKQSPLQWF